MAFTNKLQQLVLHYTRSEYDYPKERVSGRTTAYALQAIGVALSAPSYPTPISMFKLKDFNHHPSSSVFEDQVEYLIKTLKLQFLDLDREKGTLTYSIY